MYKVEKNIPLPVKVEKNKTKYPLDYMAIGDSFLIPFTKEKYSSNSIKVPYRAAKRKGMKITRRCEKNGIRVWRIK